MAGALKGVNFFLQRGSRSHARDELPCALVIMPQLLCFYLWYVVRCTRNQYITTKFKLVMVPRRRHIHATTIIELRHFAV